MVKIKPDPKQRCLEQHQFHSKTKHSAIIKRTTDAARNAKTPATGISYRECGVGKGAFWDHYTIQEQTQTPTAILKPKEFKCSRLHDYMRQVTLEFPSEITNLELKSPSSPSRLPPSPRAEVLSQTSTSMDEFGLLFIPGMARATMETEEYRIRKEFETAQIKEARLRGRPVLAVCGGSWTLWEAFGGTVKPVEEHNYRGGMPRLDAKSGHVIYNKQIHRIEIQEEGKILSGAMKIDAGEGINPTVNSVHWMAPSEINIPAELVVSAKSLADPSIAPNINVKGVVRPLNPEPCIEAFETKFGVPMLGIQWHLEAYGNSPEDKIENIHQLGIINEMAQAGKTFQLKQAMLAQFKTFVLDKTENDPWVRHPLRRTKLGKKYVWRSVKSQDPRLWGIKRKHLLTHYELLKR